MSWFISKNAMVVLEPMREKKINTGSNQWKLIVYKTTQEWLIEWTAILKKWMVVELCMVQRRGKEEHSSSHNIISKSEWMNDMYYPLIH